MSQVITNAFEQYWQSCLAAEKPVVLDEFILADIPNLDITSPIDPETGLPPESQIVHRQNVDQRGRINNNAVAYTIVMDTTVGDFSFNAMYLRNKANGVIGMIVYKGRETKLKTDQTTGQTGNSLVKSMLMGYDQAAEATLTHVDAGTWQIDYAARLRGMDEDIRQLQADLYGHHTFVGDGFKVVEKDGAYQVTQGVAIIGGLRVELKAPEVIHPGTKPIGVWVDVYRAGSLLSEHQNHFTIITSVADLADHVDSNGYQHYVAKLGTVQVDNTVVDGRGNTGNGGTGSIPDTFALWKRSMAEAGYDLIGQFGTEMTIETADQVILSRDGIEVFSWTGELPKKVTAQCSPVGEILWTRRTGELLYQKLSLATGSSLVGDDVDGSVAEALEKSRINVREVRNEALQRWNATGEIVPDKANMIDPEAGHKYDEMGAQYSYVADTCFVLEDFEYGPSASPAWNSRVFNALIKRAKGMFIASRTVDAIVQHDAPIDVLNRVTIMLPQSLRIRKTGAAIGSVVRTIKPAGSEMQSYTFNKDCLFNIIPEDNKINYAVYVNIIGGDFGGDGHSNKGIFDAPMAAYCTISRVIGSESSFFWSGLDNFQNTFDDIRSRFSNKHFLIDRGTSNNFSRVACDGGKDGTSIGVGFQLGCSYTTMIACAADKIQASYDFYGNAEVTMIGCGSEAFGRLIRVRDNAVAVVKGGKLEYDVVDSNVGVAAEPWSAYDNSVLTLEGTTLVANNYSEYTDEVAFGPLLKPIAVGSARIIANECKHPSASSVTPVFQGDEITVQSNAYGEWKTGSKCKQFTARSLRTTQAADKQRFQKEVENVPVNATWVTVGKFDLSSYGSSVMGGISLTLYGTYASSVGLVAFAQSLFAAAQHSTGGVVTTDLSQLVCSRVDFSPAQPTPNIELQFVTSGQNALMQVKLTSGGGTWGPISVSVDVEYTARYGGKLGRIDFV